MNHSTSPSSAFAQYLAQENVRHIIANNVTAIKNAPPEGKLAFLNRLLLNAPCYAPLNSQRQLCEKSVMHNETNIWLDLICATAIADLTDQQGDLKQDIKEEIHSLLTAECYSLFTDEQIKRALFCSYLVELVGAQLSKFYLNKLNEKKISPMLIEKIADCVYCLNIRATTANLNINELDQNISSSALQFAFQHG